MQVAEQRARRSAPATMSGIKLGYCQYQTKHKMHAAHTCTQFWCLQVMYATNQTSKAFDCLKERLRTKQSFPVPIVYHTLKDKAVLTEIKVS